MRLMLAFWDESPLYFNGFLIDYRPSNNLLNYTRLHFRIFFLLILLAAFFLFSIHLFRAKHSMGKDFYKLFMIFLKKNHRKTFRRATNFFEREFMWWWRRQHWKTMFTGRSERTALNPSKNYNLQLSTAHAHFNISLNPFGFHTFFVHLLILFCFIFNYISQYTRRTQKYQIWT